MNNVFKMATSTHALLPTFPEESWVLECTCQTRVDGQIRFEYGYMWTWKFLNPERKSCGFKNIQIRVDGPLLIYVNRLRLRIAKGVNITVKFVSIAFSFGYVINIYILYLSCTNAQIKHAKK